MEDLESSILQNESQLAMVKQALQNAENQEERESLLALQSELEELIQLTKESLNAKQANSVPESSLQANDNTSNEIDDEYALFMKEMAETGAYDKDKNDIDNAEHENDSDSDIENELASMLGMKCAVYHTHSWGGQPTLYNAMVSSVVPRQDEDQFNDLQVRVLFTHPTHAEMLPCPFFLNGECKFSDELCRYSHGAIFNLSNLKEAIEPDYDSVKVGSVILLKIKPPNDEDMSTAKKSTEKYHLWHRAIVKGVDLEQRSCVAKLEQAVQVGEKRKSGSEEYHVQFEEMFPLDGPLESDSEDSLSDTEYPEAKSLRQDADTNTLLVEKCLLKDAPAMGEWERHTRGMGSKLMLAMGYVPGAGLGAAGAGRVLPVEATVRAPRAGLQETQPGTTPDPLKVAQKLKKLQKKEEERNKRAYEREKERERRNVFNFINKTLGDKDDNPEPSSNSQQMDIKQSTSKDLNIEKFKITEDCRKIESEIIKLQNSLIKYPTGTNGHTRIATQISEKNKMLHTLRDRERKITNEQKHRKDKQNMTVF